MYKLWDIRTGSEDTYLDTRKLRKFLRETDGEFKVFNLKTNKYRYVVNIYGNFYFESKWLNNDNRE